MPNIDKYKKWMEIMKTLDTFSTKEEFIEAFKAAMKQILTLEKKLIEKLNNDSDVLKTDFGNTRKIEKGDFDKLTSETQKITDKLFKEQADNLNFLNDKVRNIKNGKDGKDGKNGINGKDGSPDTEEEILDKILPLSIEDIKDLRDELDKLKKQKAYGGGGGMATGGRIVKVHDLSASLNGVLKTFSLPSFWRVLSVQSSSFPNAFRPTVDYTTDASTMKITFTSEITASSTLATGQTIIVMFSE